MSGVRKIIPPTPHRSRTPLFDWIRKKLLKVERNEPSGIPGPNGECQYVEHTRFPDTQASRSPDLPKIPGGVYHKLAENYYFERDARRAVEPPKLIVKDGAVMESAEAKPISELLSNLPPPAGPAVSAGPRDNFGLGAITTPGMGYVWQREIQNEENTQRIDPNLRYIEKYDGYRK